MDHDAIFPFMKLPKELRLLIYEMIPREIRHTIIQTRRPNADENQPGLAVTLISRSTSTAILATSRKIHDECKSIVQRTMQDWVLNGNSGFVTSSELPNRTTIEAIIDTVVAMYDIAAGHNVPTATQGIKSDIYQRSVKTRGFECLPSADTTAEFLLSTIDSVHETLKESGEDNCIVESVSHNLSAIVAFIDRITRSTVYLRTCLAFIQTPEIGCAIRCPPGRHIQSLKAYEFQDIVVKSTSYIRLTLAHRGITLRNFGLLGASAPLDPDHLPLFSIDPAFEFRKFRSKGEWENDFLDLERLPSTSNSYTGPTRHDYSATSL